MNVNFWIGVGVVLVSTFVIWRLVQWFIIKNLDYQINRIEKKDKLKELRRIKKMKNRKITKRDVNNELKRVGRV